MPGRATQGSTRFGQEAEAGVRESQARGCVPGKGKAGQCRVISSGLANLNTSGGLQAIGVVSSCLVPRLGMI